MKAQTKADTDWERQTNAAVLFDETSVLKSDSEAFQQVYTTVPTGSTGSSRSLQSAPAALRVIAELAGVTVGATPEHVLVKLQDQNLTVHFPRELFADNEVLADYGTPIRYQIVERPNGFRYQRFEPALASPDQAQLEELNDILDGIKYRTG